MVEVKYTRGVDAHGALPQKDEDVKTVVSTVRKDQSLEEPNGSEVGDRGKDGGQKDRDGGHEVGVNVAELVNAILLFFQAVMGKDVAIGYNLKQVTCTVGEDLYWSDHNGVENDNTSRYGHIEMTLQHCIYRMRRTWGMLTTRSTKILGCSGSLEREGPRLLLRVVEECDRRIGWSGSTLT